MAITRRSTPRVFLETSVLLRFLTKDDAKKYSQCLALIESIEEGRVRPYISRTVVLEIVFILDRVYGFSKKEILGSLRALLSLRNLTLIEKGGTSRALSLWDTYAIKFGDCVIATEVPAGVLLVTYDKHFSLVPEIKTVTPEDVLRVIST